MRAKRVLALAGSAFLMAGLIAAPSVVGSQSTMEVSRPLTALSTSLPTYRVTRVGITQAQADSLARSLQLPRAFDRDGSFRYVSDRINDIPMVQGSGEFRFDEDGQDTVRTAFDFDAINILRPISNSQAISKAAAAFKGAGITLPSNSARASNTTLNLQALDAKSPTAHAIDTNVRFEFKLAGQIYTGPGAKADITFDPAGNITGLHHSVFSVAANPTVRLIPAADASRTCAARLPAGVRLSLAIVYWAPALSKAVKTIFPWYACSGTTRAGQQLLGGLIPAVSGIGPSVTLTTSARGARVTGSAKVSGGLRPYTFSWQSATTDLSTSASNKSSVSYDVRPRVPTSAETLILTVTDANGVTRSVEKSLTVPAAATGSRIVAAAVRPIPQSLSVIDVGGEFNVWEWQCVKDSASGFQSQFASQGVPVAFKWTGTNAWEQDFRDTVTAGGDDSNSVDDVDLAWYTGHGSPGAFTFDNDDHTDGSIVPADARWGQRDLEWLNLESCNVLQFADGSGNAFARWGQRFDGLHLLNGFQTTASCVNVSGGTAGRFSFYLFEHEFPFFTMSALKVRQAWSQMARDLEPSGKQWVSMGVYGAGGVTNYDDYFWGQGPVGPDIPKDLITGRWWLMGTV